MPTRAAVIACRYTEKDNAVIKVMLFSSKRPSAVWRAIKRLKGHGDGRGGTLKLKFSTQA